MHVTQKTALAFASALSLLPRFPYSSTTFVKHLLLKDLMDSYIFAQSLEDILLPLDRSNSMEGQIPEQVRPEDRVLWGHAGEGFIFCN